MRAAIFNILSERIARKLRKDFYESLINKDIAFYDARRTGDLSKTHSALKLFFWHNFSRNWYLRTFPWLKLYVFSLSLELGRSGDLRCAGHNLLYVRARYASDCRHPDHLADHVTDAHWNDSYSNHSTCGLLTVLPEMDARNLAFNPSWKRQDEHTCWGVYLQHPHCQGIR